jgi:hypothetical protein
MMSYGPLLARLTDADQHPAIRRALDAGVFDEPDEPDADYRFGMQAILDGLDALMRSRR